MIAFRVKPEGSLKLVRAPRRLPVPELGPTGAIRYAGDPLVFVARIDPRSWGRG